MKNLIVILFIAGLAALSISSRTFDKRQVSKEMLRFIESKNYTYSIRKSNIPELVSKNINEYEKGCFSIGDKRDADSGKTFLSCTGSGQFKGFLDFVLVNDSTCLLGYTTGSFSLYSVIYFVQYKNDFILAKYERGGMGIIKDTLSLKEFLLKDPRPDAIWIKHD